jgi:hypothetical protein
MRAANEVPDVTPAANINLNKGFGLSLRVDGLSLSRETKILTCRSGVHNSADWRFRTSPDANTGKLNCRLVGHKAKAGLGDRLAPLDGIHPPPNDHRKAGVGQGLAPARWTKLALQALRRVRKPPLKKRLRHTLRCAERPLNCLAVDPGQDRHRQRGHAVICSVIEAPAPACTASVAFSLAMGAAGLVAARHPSKDYQLAGDAQLPVIEPSAETTSHATI